MRRKFILPLLQAPELLLVFILRSAARWSSLSAQNSFSTASTVFRIAERHGWNPRRRRRENGVFRGVFRIRERHANRCDVDKRRIQHAIRPRPAESTLGGYGPKIREIPCISPLTGNLSCRYQRLVGARSPLAPFAFAAAPLRRNETRRQGECHAVALAKAGQSRPVFFAERCPRRWSMMPGRRHRGESEEAARRNAFDA